MKTLIQITVFILLMVLIRKVIDSETYKQPKPAPPAKALTITSVNKIGTKEVTFTRCITVGDCAVIPIDNKPMIVTLTSDSTIFINY